MALCSLLFHPLRWLRLLTVAVPVPGADLRWDEGNTTGRRRLLSPTACVG